MRSAAASAFTRLTAIVTPPSYLGRPPESFENPEQVTMIAGSTLRLEVARIVAAGLDGGSRSGLAAAHS